MRTLSKVGDNNDVCYIFINQIRMNIGVMYGNPETTPGGRALKFFCSIRMDIRRIGQIKESNGTVTGNRTRLKIVKNKIAPPFTACEFDIMYNEGISRTGSVLDLGIEHGILSKKGAWISYNGDLIGQGREAAKQALSENQNLMNEITAAILEKAEVTVGSVLAQSTDDDS